MTLYAETVGTNRSDSRKPNKKRPDNRGGMTIPTNRTEATVSASPLGLDRGAFVGAGPLAESVYTVSPGGRVADR